MKPAYNYYVAIHGANENSKRISVAASIDGYSHKKTILTPDVVKVLAARIENFYQSFPPNMAFGASITAHLQNIEWVQTHLDPLAQLTTGYVSNERGDCLPFTVANAKRWLADGFTEGEHAHLSLHVWITLSSLEVIDITLPIGIHIARGLPMEFGNLPFVAAKPEKRQWGTTYHPVIHGDDFVRRIWVHANKGLGAPLIAKRKAI